MSSEVWVTLDAYPTLLAANLAAAIGPAGGPGFISPGYATRPPTSIEATGTSTSVIGSSTAVATTTWGVTASQITDWVTLTGTSTNPTQPFDAVLATMVFVTLPSYSILVPTNLIAGYASATMTAVSGTPSSTLASNCTATHAPQNNSGLVSKGEVAGVGVAFGLVAVLVAALAIWREMTWRRKSGRQVNSLPMQNSKARGPWLRSTAFNDDTLLGHQMTDYEVSAAVHQLLDDTKTWVQQLPLSSTPAVVTSLRDVQDTDRVMSVLPQLRRIEDLPQYVSDRRRLRSFIRGLVGLTVVESMFGNDGPKKRGESGRDHWLPTDIDTSVGALEAALLLQASPPKTTAPSQNRALDLKNFHEWRVATFSLLAKLYGESSTSWPDDAHVYIRAQAQTTVRLVRPWVNNPFNSAEFEASLVPILNKALELRCLLRRQKACWNLTFPGMTKERVNYTRPMTFSEHTMRDISSTDELKLRAVEILVSPGLFKTGNTDGQLYADGESVVRKAEVWCSTVDSR